ncbi:uncharacterized protein LOC132281810 [Cornus florida]|uniref:uncharacterized protein LOC132281810 n=1 Tax=Cornus florida TaxID=4283 RepID=UPI00289E0C5E|nr:uncharacterized protein LOC132281810 [Cornus florida]
MVLCLYTYSMIAAVNMTIPFDRWVGENCEPFGSLLIGEDAQKWETQNWCEFQSNYSKALTLKETYQIVMTNATDPKFDAWDEADSMIMSWLWNSMNPEISDTCMFLSTAKEVWDAVRQTYSKARDAAQVYEIKIKTGAMKEGGKSVTEYANSLQNLWQELDHYRCIKSKCPEDAAILKGFIEKDRVYDFLAGLNAEFDQVRVQILGKEEVPSLNETISLIQAEKNCRGVMLEPQALEGSAMVTKTERPSIQESGKADLSQFQGKGSKDTLWCTYCKKPRHTRENVGS